MQNAIPLLGQAAFDLLSSGDLSNPVGMLNMLRFRDWALYANGQYPDVKGAEAYARYGAAIMPIIERIGAKVTMTGQLSLLGPKGEWDSIFVVRYPSRRAFIDMVADPEYQKHVHHRQAALSDSRLFVLDLVDTHNIPH